MRPSQEIGQCGYTLASGRRCLGSRWKLHDHFDGFDNVEPWTYELVHLDMEIWLAECDYDLRMSGVNPDDACPAIVPFTPDKMVRA